MSYYSLRSCLDINNLLKAMFPDNETSTIFQMSKTKRAYIINYDTAPYSKKILLKDIQSSRFYYVLFGESLNRMLQEELWTFRFAIGMKIQVWPEQDTLTHSSCTDGMLIN